MLTKKTNFFNYVLEFYVIGTISILIFMLFYLGNIFSSIIYELSPKEPSPEEVQKTLNYLDEKLIMYSNEHIIEGNRIYPDDLNILYDENYIDNDIINKSELLWQNYDWSQPEFFIFYTPIPNEFSEYTSYRLEAKLGDRWILSPNSQPYYKEVIR